MDEHGLPRMAGPFVDSGTARLRVLHVHSGNMYGGVETLLLTEARWQPRQTALELSFALCFAGRLGEELKVQGVPLYWLGPARVRNPFSIMHARRNLRVLLRQQTFDVVVTHSAWSQALFGPVARAAGVPLVFQLHGAAGGRHWLERWASRTRPDVSLCNSRFTAGTLPALYPRVRSEIVYYPVAPPERDYSGEEIRAARSELQAGDDAIVIIQVSRMEEWKGQALHLEALGLLRDVPGWVCWMVGGAQRAAEKRYLEDLQGRARRLCIAERVRFLDQRADVSRLLAAADIFCQPNTGPEPFGIAFVEALYARLPVVTTGFGGALEIVDDSCGLLVPPHDKQALADSLRELVRDENLRARLGAAGPLRARRLCDPAAQMERLYEVLASVAVGQRVKG